MGQRLQLRLFCEWAHRCLSHVDLSVRHQVKVEQRPHVCSSLFVTLVMPFLRSRLFWVSVMCWRPIPTSFMCVIELPSVWCFTLPVPNSRGRCCPSYACTSLLVRTVTVTTVVRPRLDFTSLDRFCILGCCIIEVNNSLMWILWQVTFRWPPYIWDYFCRETAQPQ